MTPTQTYRRIQLALRAKTMKDLMKLWPAFDLNRISDTWPAFEAAALPLITRHGRDAAQLAGMYYQTHRTYLGISGEVAIRFAEIPEEQILNGLRFNGPINAGMQLAKGREVVDVAQTSLVRVLGTSTNHVLGFGRETILESLRSDSKAFGWQRVAGGDACAFCAMLISRGPIYKEATVGFEAHRACACSAEPVYDPDRPLTDQATRYRDIWDESTEGLHYREAFNAFRQALGK
jgi:hypothetical protein